MIKILDKKYTNDNKVEAYKLEIDGECLGWVSLEKCKQLKKNNTYRVEVDKEGRGVIGEIGYIHNGEVFIQKESKNTCIVIDITKYNKRSLDINRVCLDTVEIVSNKEGNYQINIELYGSTIKNIKNFSDTIVNIGMTECNIDNINTENISEIKTIKSNINNIEATCSSLDIDTDRTDIKNIDIDATRLIRYSFKEGEIGNVILKSMKAIEYINYTNKSMKNLQIEAEQVSLYSKAKVGGETAKVTADNIYIDSLDAVNKWELNGNVIMNNVELDRNKLKVNCTIPWRNIKDLGKIKSISLWDYGKIILDSNDYMEADRIENLNLDIVDGATGVKVYIHNSITLDNGSVDKDGIINIEILSKKNVEIITDYGSELHKQLLCVKGLKFTVNNAPSNYQTKIDRQRMFKKGEIGLILRDLGTHGNVLRDEEIDLDTLDHSLVKDFIGGYIEVNKVSKILLNILREYGIKVTLNLGKKGITDKFIKIKGVKLGYQYFTMRATNDIMIVSICYEGDILESYIFNNNLLSIYGVDDKYDTRLNVLHKIDKMYYKEKVVVFKDVIDIMGNERKLIDLYDNINIVRLSYRNIDLWFNSNGEIEIASNINNNKVIKFNTDKKTIERIKKKVIESFKDESKVQKLRDEGYIL